ncbi:SDR family oxidoreductase [Mucilaginibacter sp. RS28]|uniref:SDR family oxidoreductase n=1 Tax=Mucilaginibacter straminoryzae TaxID=2932774 RepID=A0A9X1X3C8_9SPHI|nr:SDR family oxidoreductase [Mucilaginibacter straminoryzae]MCJ8209335.1 SDR family oxidoreductase [Mucilaginibacter straminoryzae]
MSLLKVQTERAQPINKKTIVITGASSGIGRATAIELARYGCTLVLAARQKDALEEVADVCDRLGAKAMVAVTDVTDAASVKQLAKDACLFGKSIDVWINIAGIGVMGEFTTVPIEVHDQVIKTNLMGYMHGAHAVLPYFKKQKFGTIINVNSVGGWVAMPYAAAYDASKFGLRGFSEGLRGELSDCPDIHICDVFPSFVDTPGPKHAGNYTGKKLKPVPPVVPTYKVAKAIAGLVFKPKSTTIIGASAYLAKAGYAISPRLTRWSLLKLMQMYFKQAECEPVTNGNAFEPTGADNRIAGGYASKTITPSRVQLAGLVGVAAAGAFFIVRKLF